jgi:hypothetical protein
MKNILFAPAWNEWGRSWWPCFHNRETANAAAFVAKTMAEVSQ